MGTLCAELDKLGGGADRDAAAVMARIIDWAEEQFRQLGRRDARNPTSLAARAASWRWIDSI